MKKHPEEIKFSNVFLYLNRRRPAENSVNFKIASASNF